MTHKMAKQPPCSAHARHPSATRDIPRDKVRFCYLRHDYLRGVGTLACASSSLNYRLILPVFLNAETIQTSSLTTSWMGNASVGFRPGFRSITWPFPLPCRWPTLLVAFSRDWLFPSVTRKEVIRVKSKLWAQNICVVISNILFWYTIVKTLVRYVCTCVRYIMVAAYLTLQMLRKRSSSSF